jgi:hypothetical protein
MHIPFPVRMWFIFNLEYRAISSAGHVNIMGSIRMPGRKSLITKNGKICDTGKNSYLSYTFIQA